MSIEAAIAANTEALLKVAGLLEASNQGREAAVAAITQAEAGATTVGRPRGSRNKAAETPPTSPPPPAPPPPAETAVPTVEDLRAAAVKYTTVPEAEKQGRKDFLKSITDHLGLPKLVECDEGDRARIIGWFGASARGEKVNFSDGEDEQQPEEDPDDIG